MNSSKISHLLEKITSAIRSPQFEKRSRIEQDLLLQNLRNLYDELVQNQPQQSADSSPLKSERSEKEVIHPHESVKFNTNKNLLIEDTIPTKQPMVPKTEAVRDIPLKESKAESVASTLNERAHSNTTLNQKVTTGSGKEIHKTFSSKPLRDLIDFNKKFAMVNELFRGNAENFNQAVKQIDAFENLEAAEQYIESELAAKNQWNITSQTSRMFFKLVKQRFGQA